MWKNIVERGRPQMTIWRMRITSWIPKATDTHLEYVILIALPLQQSLRERSSILGYTHIACLVITRSVYCAVRTGALNVIGVNFCLWSLSHRLWRHSAVMSGHRLKRPESGCLISSIQQWQSGKRAFPYCLTHTISTFLHRTARPLASFLFSKPEVPSWRPKLK